MPIVTLDGVDGSGKSTAAAVLLDFLTIDKKLDAQLIQSPGGTELGAEIRQLVKSKRFPTHKSVERLLFAADAAQLMREKLDGASPEKWFILDRFQPLTDLVYSVASGVDLEMVTELQRIAGLNVRCDMYIIFKLPYEVAMQRKEGREQMRRGPGSYGIEDAGCRIEAKGSDFLKKVSGIYNELFNHAHDEKSELEALIKQRAMMVREVDASKNSREVAEQVKMLIEWNFLSS
jgi:dTMP kinase